MQKRRPIDKNIKSTVWKQHNKFSLLGECYACKTPITHDNFEAGHIIAVANGGTDDISNLRPICRACNGSMGTMNLEQYKKKYFGSKSKTQKTKIPGSTTKPPKTKIPDFIRY